MSNIDAILKNINQIQIKKKLNIQETYKYYLNNILSKLLQKKYLYYIIITDDIENSLNISISYLINKKINNINDLKYNIFIFENDKLKILNKYISNNISIIIYKFNKLYCPMFSNIKYFNL